VRLRSRDGSTSDHHQFPLHDLENKHLVLVKALIFYETKFEEIQLFCNLFALARTSKVTAVHFLTACQALEGLHRRTFDQKILDNDHFQRAEEARLAVTRTVADELKQQNIYAFYKKRKSHNQMSLKERLDDYAVALSTISDGVAFPEKANGKIRDFRNDLVHGLRAETPDHQKLYELTTILDCMFLLKFLLIAGLSNQQIRQLTRYHRDFQYLRQPNSFPSFRKKPT
jgi:hypothetical protein